MRGRNRNHKSHHSSGGGGGGGGHHHNPLTRVYESNGPEVKIRGTAHHIAEKYLQLARDAQGSGDPVTAENHFQHAEHYLRMIATAQEQFRAQNPYYQAPPAPGEIRDEAFEGEDEEGSQAGQGQPAQGQPQQNFGNQQPSFNNQQTFNNQQPSYPPQPREQSQPYGGQQPNSNYQGRPQHHNNPPQQNQPYSPPPQPYQPPQPQPAAAAPNDVGQLPSFITGGQPQQAAPSFSGNGHDDNQNGDRFPRHRRRRHRGPGGPGGPRP
ncbi:MAG TPA: DUF4167 domain-containing protein, partial [Acetobacteraceae bacterium]